MQLITINKLAIKKKILHLSNTNSLLFINVVFNKEISNNIAPIVNADGKKNSPKTKILKFIP